MGQDNRRLQATASNIICPYSTPEQVALVQRSGVFYDFMDIYHHLYEHNIDIRAVVD